MWPHGCCGRRLVRINFACNSPADPSNHDFTTLGLQRFQPLLKPLPIELHASFWGSGHIDTCWCRSRNPRAKRPGCLKPPSPLWAPAEPRLKLPSPLRVRNGRFWCSFRVQRRCRFQGSPVGGEQWCCRFQRRHVVAPRARKSSPCTLKTPQNRRFYVCWASFFAEEPLEGLCWASFSRQSALRPGLVGDVAHETGCRWGFCSIRNWLPACRRRVTPLMTPFPPFGGGEAVALGGVLAKLQTHWVKTAKNRWFWLNESALWQNRWLQAR